MARQSCWTDLYLRAGLAAFKVLSPKNPEYIKRRSNWYRFVAAGSSGPLYSPFIFQRTGAQALQFEPKDQFDQRQRKLDKIIEAGYTADPPEFPWNAKP